MLSFVAILFFARACRDDSRNNNNNDALNSTETKKMKMMNTNDGDNDDNNNYYYEIVGGTRCRPSTQVKWTKKNASSSGASVLNVLSFICGSTA